MPGCFPKWLDQPILPPVIHYVLVDPSFFPQHLLYSDLIFANLIVGLIYISPIANEVDHLFTYLLATWVFSTLKMLLSASCPFFYWVVLMQDFPIVGPVEHWFWQLRLKKGFTCPTRVENAAAHCLVENSKAYLHSQGFEKFRRKETCSTLFSLARLKGTCLENPFVSNIC